MWTRITANTDTFHAMTTTAFASVENKISDHSKHITTPQFCKSTVKNCATRSAQVNLTSKNDIANFIIKTDFNYKLK